MLVLGLSAAFTDPATNVTYKPISLTWEGEGDADFLVKEFLNAVLSGDGDTGGNGVGGWHIASRFA